MSKQLTLLGLLLFLNSCGIFKSYERHPKTEFRGVWIATVVNIDWPKNGNDSTEKQKSDFLKILDFYQKENYNAVIVQVRAAGDAFYKSEYAPFSRFLTGEEGRAPNWNIDVLDWMITEAHQRGMEFHAWLNPYRAVVNYKEYRSNPYPLTYKKPEWFINYGQNKYFDPGSPAVRNYTIKVVSDIVLNYDIDAIHFDDYFYPYKVNGQEFNDQRSFKKHGGDLYPFCS